MMKKLVRLLSLVRKALAILLTQGPVEFTRSMRRGLIKRRYVLGPIDYTLRVTLPTLTQTLFHEGPVECWRCAVRLSNEKTYRRLCQLKAAEYADAEIGLKGAQPNLTNRPGRERNPSPFSV